MRYTHHPRMAYEQRITQQYPPKPPNFDRVSDYYPFRFQSIEYRRAFIQASTMRYSTHYLQRIHFTDDFARRFYAAKRRLRSPVLPRVIIH